MDRRQIIMNYTLPPSNDDIEVIASAALEALPEELLELCESLMIKVEDVPDETIEIEFELDDPYDMMVLFRSGKELSPGVESKVANDDDFLIIYRRPFLDYWCEQGEDINHLMRQVIIEELGANYDFDDDEIDDMVKRQYQGTF